MKSRHAHSASTRALPEHRPAIPEQHPNITRPSPTTARTPPVVSERAPNKPACTEGEAGGGRREAGGGRREGVRRSLHRRCVLPCRVAAAFASPLAPGLAHHEHRPAVPTTARPPPDHRPISRSPGLSQLPAARLDPRSRQVSDAASASNMASSTMGMSPRAMRLKC